MKNQEQAMATAEEKFKVLKIWNDSRHDSKQLELNASCVCVTKQPTPPFQLYYEKGRNVF